MFHVALKFQYLHTSTLPPCTFALAGLKTPGGNPGTKAVGGQTGGHAMHTDSIMELMFLHLGHLHRHAPQVVPARVARVPPVVDAPDNGDSGVSGVSAQTPRVRLRPKQKAMPGKPKQQSNTKA